MAGLAAVLVVVVEAFAPAQVVSCTQPLQEVHETMSVYSFDDLAVIDSNNVWATGESEDTYFSHWDGEQWKPVLGPEPSRGEFNLRALAGVVKNDIWAVGFAGFGDSRAVILHRNFKMWSTIKVPRVGRQSTLLDVVALPDGTALAVGAFSPVDRKGIRPLVYFFDGTEWRRDPVGLAGKRFGLTDIAADLTYGAWFVTTDPGFALFRAPDGSWTRVRLPRDDVYLRDVTITPEGSAWFVAEGGGGRRTPLVYRHMNAWRRYDVPDMEHSEYLVALDATSDSNVWVTGYRISGDTGYPYVLRSSSAEGPFEYVDAGNPGTVFFRDIELDEAGGVWAVGETGGGIVQRAC